MFWAKIAKKTAEKDTRKNGQKIKTSLKIDPVPIQLYTFTFMVIFMIQSAILPGLCVVAECARWPLTTKLWKRSAMSKIIQD